MTTVKGQLSENLCDSMERQLTVGNRPHWGWQGLASRVLQISKQINIPPEPTRAGAQDGSTIDNTATDRGMDITMNEDTAHETTTAAAEHSRQVYTCGWAKITSLRERYYPPRKERLHERPGTRASH